MRKSVLQCRVEDAADELLEADPRVVKGPV